MDSYKRRLVCNTCEKAKLREEGIKKLNTKYGFWVVFNLESLKKGILQSRREHIIVDPCIHQPNVFKYYPIRL